MGTLVRTSAISSALLLLMICSSVPDATAFTGRGFAPEVLLASDSIVVEAGGTLNLTCRDTQRIVWLALQEDLNYENYEETYDAGHERPHTANLVMKNVNYTNVGYYFCIHNTTENKDKRMYSPNDYNVTAVYVYVRDLNHLLAKEAERLFLSPKVGKNFTFPCKPTFPEVQVTLDKNQGAFGNATYDSRSGFLFGKPSVRKHAGDYFCEATYDDVHETVFASVMVVPAYPHILKEPTVNVSNFWQRNAIEEHFDNADHYDVEEGSTVNLTCKYPHDPLVALHQNWSFPDKGKNETGTHLIYRYLQHSVDMARTLVITSADPKIHSGEFSCIVSNKTHSMAKKVVINVLPYNSYSIDLMLEDSEAENNLEEDINLRVMFSAYPLPTFIWRKEGEVVANSSNPKQGNDEYTMEVKHDDGNLFLTLKSPSITDIGFHSLEAIITENETVQARKEVFFNVTFPVSPSRPTIEFEANNTKYSNGMLPQNKDFKVICSSIGYPKPDLSLEFQQCFSKENCTDFEVISKNHEDRRNHLRRSSFDQTKKTFTKGIGVWEGKALVQGYYRCSVENSKGREAKPIVEKIFLLSDSGRGTLDITVEVNGIPVESSPQVRVVETDNVTLLCLGQKMLTSPPLKWKLNGRSLSVRNSSSTYIPTEGEMDLVYSSKIRMDRISVPEEGKLNFVCEDNRNSNLKDVLELHVRPMKLPKWLTKEEPLQDHFLKEMGNLTLKCLADGVPEPKIRWYKDDEPLEETNRNEKSHRMIKGPEINFSYLKISDSGLYKCEAANRFDTISSEAFITVTDPDAFANINIIIIMGVLSGILIVLSIFICIKIRNDRKRAYNIRLEDQRMFEQGDPENLNPELGLESQAELLPYDTKYEVSRDSIVFDKLLGAGAFGRVYRAKVLNLIPGQPRSTVAVKMMKSRTDCAQLKALRSEVKIMIHIGRHVNIVNLLGACSKDLATKGELLLLVEYCKHGNILDYMRRRRKDFINQINECDKIDPTLSEARIRQRSESGSRSRMLKGLRYAHLSFNQDLVTCTMNSETPTESLWIEPPSSPTNSIVPNGHVQETFRARTASSSSPLPVTSDMSTFTYESSTGGSDNGYIGSRAVGTSPVPLCTKDLLSWAYQVAKGMEYLAFKKVLHGDLAARNILLTEDNIVKISDFGLAKDIYKNDNYRKKSKTPVPWKWLAVECFRDGVFSTQSDIWAYGVVLWEIFSLGQSPYPGVDFDESFITRLEKGVRPDQPKYATYDLYRIMLECWVNEPMERPSFSTLESILGVMIDDSERQHYLELNQECQMENTASTFLNSLQSPDYSAKIREKIPNQDQDGYEMPFSPSPLGAIALPHCLDAMQNSRLTPLQMQFMHNGDRVDGVLIDEAGSIYVPMSSPTKSIQNVFNFDEDVVDSMKKRDSDIHQCMKNFSDEECVNENQYLHMQSSPNSDKSPSLVLQSNNVIPMRHKLVRTASQMDKHDSGLYSPTANIQTNPNYMIMHNFFGTDENNYLTKDIYNSCNGKEHNYINIGDDKFKSFQRDYVKDAVSNGEYANLLPSENCKRRTVSEASSGLGSVSEESSPEYKDKPDSFKSSIMESVMEEPIYV